MRPQTSLDRPISGQSNQDNLGQTICDAAGGMGCGSTTDPQHLDERRRLPPEPVDPHAQAAQRIVPGMIRKRADAMVSSRTPVRRTLRGGPGLAPACPGFRSGPRSVRGRVPPSRAAEITDLWPPGPALGPPRTARRMDRQHPDNPSRFDSVPIACFVCALGFGSNPRRTKTTKRASSAGPSDSRGRSSTPMGLEPAIVTEHPAAHPVEP